MDGKTFASILCSVLAASGFWAFIQSVVMKSHDSRSARGKMLKGLGHDRIIFLGMSYVTRGWISQDEYENLYEYLYKPYKELGGNGSADRVMNEVNKLPIRKLPYVEGGDSNEAKRQSV